MAVLDSSSCSIVAASWHGPQTQRSEDDELAVAASLVWAPYDVSAFVLFILGIRMALRLQSRLLLKRVLGLPLVCLLLSARAAHRVHL